MARGRRAARSPGPRVDGRRRRGRPPGRLPARRGRGAPYPPGRRAPVGVGAYARRGAHWRPGSVVRPVVAEGARGVVAAPHVDRSRAGQRAVTRLPTNAANRPLTGQGAVTRRSTLFPDSEIPIQGSNPDPWGQLRRSGESRGKRPLSDRDSPMELLRVAADRTSRTTTGATPDSPSDRTRRPPAQQSGEASSPSATAPGDDR
jgi:hypothetical protein